MTSFSQLKSYIIAFVAAYAVYLFSYKCEELKNSPLQNAADAVLHPLTHSHHSMCRNVNQAQSLVQPYIAQGKKLFQQYVLAHPTAKLVKLDAKMYLVQKQYYTHVAPVLLEVFKVIEHYERVIYDYIVQAYQHIVAVVNQKAKKL